MFSPKRNDIVLSVFPYFHLAGLLNGLVWVLKEGGTSIILPKYEQKSFLQCVERFRVSNVQQKAIFLENAQSSF